MDAATRKWMWEFGAAMTLYTVAVLVAGIVLRRMDETLWHVPVALLPMIPTALGMLAFLRYLDRADELQRRIHLQAVGFAFAATAFITFTYGWLENAGLPQLSMTLVLPLMVATWGIGMGIATRRYA